jgi:hypothetical protein
MRSNVNFVTKWFVLPVIGAVLILGPAAARTKAAEKTRLRLSLKAGQTFKEKVTMDQNIKQTVMGTKMDIKQVMSMVFRFEILDVDSKGLANCKITYDAMAMKQDGPMGSKEFDSAKTDTEPPKEMKPIAALVGQGFTLSIAPNGRVSNVKGADALLKKMFKDMDLPAAMRDTMEKQLKGQFGDQAIGEMMEKMLAVYPDRPVAIGESWQRQFAVTAGMPMVMDNTWTLKEVRDGTAVIDVVSKITADSKAKPMEIGPMKMKFELSGDQKGTIEVPLDSGWIATSKLTQDVKGNVEMSGAPGSDTPMSFPMSIKSTTTLEKVEK